MAENTPDTDQPIEDTPAQNATEAAIDLAQQAAEKVDEAVRAEAIDLPDFEPNGSETGVDAGMNLLNDVSLKVTIELGRTLMYVEDVLRLNEDSVIELDKAAGDPVDIYVNDRHVARGEVLVLNENFCVRISEIMQLRGLEGTAE